MNDSTQPKTKHTTARYFLEGLQETGIRYLFSNLGTDHVTLIDEMARLQAEGQAMPEVVLCPHENVAIHMAGGYAAVTGQGQGVMVHVDAGTANAAMGMHNLMRARLPVLLMAGKAPYALHGEVPGARDNYVHYVQDPFDIGSLVRPYVKWEYNLPSGVVAKEVVRGFVREGPTEAELQAAKSNLVGGFALRIDSNRKLLDNVANIAWHGLPLNYLDTWTQQVQAVTTADIRRAFQRVIQPDRMVTVVVGGR
jgi:hypothetical protein